MSLKELDFDHMSIEELEKALLDNQKEVSKMRKEIKKLESIELNEIVNELNNDTKIELKQSSIKENKKIEDEELDYYYEDLKLVKNSNSLYNDIKDILPSKKNYRYNELIIKLKLILLKEIREIENLLNDEENLDIEILDEFKQDIILNKSKIEIINRISKEENSLDDYEEQENNLIFTTTSSGNIRALEEIKSIDQAFYERFETLFLSIKDGTFKRAKLFHSSNNKTAGVREVKDHKVRVVFDRISKHDYAIITVFTKKSDNDKGYLQNLEDKIAKYKNQKDYMISMLDNEEYRNDNKKYEQELFNRLNPNNKKLLKK